MPIFVQPDYKKRGKSMDIFFEQIVKKKKSVAEAATVALIYVAGLLLGIVIAVAAFVFVPVSYTHLM